MSVSINKTLLKHCHAHAHSLIYCNCFCPTTAEPSICNRGSRWCSHCPALLLSTVHTSSLIPSELTVFGVP